MFDFAQSLSIIFSNSPATFISFAVILGLLFGSLLNVIIYRMPKIMEREWHNSCLVLLGKEVPEQTAFSLSYPRSSCPKCHHPISALENIPIISYLVLRGKCKACQNKISMRYPLVETMTGALLGLIAYQFGYTFTTIFAWAFTLALIALTFIDFDTQLLPDDITLPLLWLGLLFNLDGGFTDLQSAVIGAATGYLILWSIYWLFKIVTKKEGMGYGDFKLLAAIGAWFGWQLIPAVILLSSLLGATIGIILIVWRGQTTQTAIPFGPFLALGGIAALFFGKQLTYFYLI